MKYLKQTLLFFILVGIMIPQAFAHSGDHHMAVFEGIIHFVSSSIHTGPVIAVISVILAIKIYRKWIR